MPKTPEALRSFFSKKNYQFSTTHSKQALTTFYFQNPEGNRGRIRRAHDRSEEQGLSSGWLALGEARYFVLSGDRVKALDWLTEAANSDEFMVSDKLAVIWPELGVFAGDPDYDAMQTRIIDRVNTQRAELGLEPMSI